MSAGGDFNTISVKAEGAVGELLLDRPEKLNALSAELLGELVAAAAWFDRQPELKSVLIRGAGRAFSGGADVSAMGPAGGDRSANAELLAGLDLGRRATEAIAGMHALTVAAIHGHCVGGGVVLAAACDIRLAAADTLFSLPEVDLGIPLTWGGIPRLVRELGPSLTKDLVLTCRPCDAAELAGRGFLSRVVPADRLLEEARAVVAKLCEQSLYTLRLTKQHVDAVAEESGSTAQSFREAETLLAALGDEESNAVMARYLQARRARG